MQKQKIATTAANAARCDTAAADDNDDADVAIASDELVDDSLTRCKIKSIVSKTSVDRIDCKRREDEGERGGERERMIIQTTSSVSDFGLKSAIDRPITIS